MSLPLDLPGIIVLDAKADGPIFSIHAGCEGRPAACPACGEATLHAHGTMAQDIMDLPHQGRCSCVHLAGKRWKCAACGTTFFHPLSWIDDDHRATSRFVERIGLLTLERSFTDLAREYGVHERTIRNIFLRRYQPVIDNARFESPAYLGIDELNVAGAARGVLTNLDQHAAIELLPRCTNEAFRAYFAQMPDRQNVRAVAMDCTKRYKDLVREFFPQAAVVVDKYHIVRMADYAVDCIRKSVRQGIVSKRTKLKLKKDHWTLKTRAHNLTDWQKTALASWRQEFPIIGATYDLKEEFYAIYEAASRHEAKMRFLTWRSHIPRETVAYWQPVLTTWSNWENEILAFFEVNATAGGRLTNAYTECQNGLTRAIDRTGRGYSFDVLRVKLLLAPKKQGIVTSYRTIRKRRRSGGLDELYSMAGAYEEERIPERRVVTWGVDIERLEAYFDQGESPLTKTTPTEGPRS